MRKKRQTLTQRVEKLERELAEAQRDRTKRTHAAIDEGMRRFREENHVMHFDRRIHQLVQESERRLLEQLRPHMVDVKVTYRGVYEPGDEFTVRA